MIDEARKHQIKFFINKFEAIPDAQWCVNRSTDHLNRHCVLGHLGLREGDGFGPPMHTEASLALTDLFTSLGRIAEINDGKQRAFQQPTPRARVLAALYDLLET